MHCVSTHGNAPQSITYLNGRLLQNHVLSQSDATYMLSTEKLEAGMYLLQLLDDAGRVLGTEKVIVSK